MYPHNPQLEKDLIWLMLDDHKNIPKIASYVVPSDFYSNIHRANYENILASYRANGLPDLQKVERIYEYESNDFVSTLWIPSLTAKLREVSKARALSMLSDTIKADSSKAEVNADKIIQDAVNRLSHISRATETERTDAKSILDNVQRTWEETKGKDLLGFSTGLKELDYVSKGFQKGYLWVVGGYTNYGKTTLAIKFLANVLKNYEAPLLFCSIEMSKEQILEKVVSCIANESTAWVRNNFHTEIVQNAVKTVGVDRLVVTDLLNTVGDIAMKAKEMEIMGNKPEIIFVDFIQNIQGNGASEYERITKAIMELQNLSKQMKTCIVVLSQVNNQSPKGDSETIGFKSSGALAHCADLTIQIRRDKQKEIGDAEAGNTHDVVDMGLVIQKNRHGRGGYISIDFDTTKGLIINK